MMCSWALDYPAASPAGTGGSTRLLRACTWTSICSIIIEPMLVRRGRFLGDMTLDGEVGVTGDADNRATAEGGGGGIEEDGERVGAEAGVVVAETGAE